MAENGHGGARAGAGRKATGHTKKSYTITLPMNVGLDLEERAAQCNKKVHWYIRDLIISAVQYENVNVEGLHVDEPKEEKDTDLRKKPVASYSLDSFDQLPMAAEEVKPYDRSN